MKITTQNFGSVTYQDEDILTFNEGLPGFTKTTKYIIIEKEELAPFCWLQSIERPDVSFVIVDPKKFRPNYKIVVPEDDLSDLKLKCTERTKIYSLVTLDDDPEKVTMNLKAPIVINIDNKIGAQVILRNTDYDIEYKMFAPSKTTERKYKNYESGIHSGYVRRTVDIQVNC